MSLLEGFSVFNFNEGAPYVSITKNGVTFNKGVVLKMKSPAYVLLLINAKEKQIAIKTCEADTQNAYQFFVADKKKEGVYSVRWNQRDLLNTLSEITEWDLSNESYKVPGVLIQEESAMLFDLQKAEQIS